MKIEQRQISPSLTRVITKQPVDEAIELVPGEVTSAPAKDVIVKDELLARLPSGAAFLANAARPLNLRAVPDDSPAPLEVTEFQPPSWKPEARAIYHTAGVDQTTGNVILERYPDPPRDQGLRILPPEDTSEYDYFRFSSQPYVAPPKYRDDPKTIEQTITPSGETSVKFFPAVRGRVQPPVADFELKLDSAGKYSAFAKGQPTAFTLDPEGNGAILHTPGQDTALGWLMGPSSIGSPGSEGPLPLGRQEPPPPAPTPEPPVASPAPAPVVEQRKSFFSKLLPGLFKS